MTVVDRPRLTGPFTTFLTTLAERTTLTPRMIRLTFRGGDLVDFADAGPDTFLYLLVPPPGCDELAIDRSFTWEGLRVLPEAVRPVGAYYSLRAHRPEEAEVDVDVLLHEPAGPASSWAVTAAPGAPLALWGPRRLYHPLPTDDHVLLVGDETAIPAITAILASLDPGQRATAFIEVAAASDELPVDVSDGGSVTWIHRGDDRARDSRRLLDAVAGAALDGQVYAWGGGESGAMARVRRHLHDERGIDPSCTEVIAYWRQAPSRAEVEQGTSDDDE